MLQDCHSKICGDMYIQEERTEIILSKWGKSYWSHKVVGTIKVAEDAESYYLQYSFHTYQYLGIGSITRA